MLVEIMTCVGLCRPRSNYLKSSSPTRIIKIFERTFSNESSLFHTFDASLTKNTFLTGNASRPTYLSARNEQLKIKYFSSVLTSVECRDEVVIEPQHNSKSVLEPCEEDVSLVAPYFPPTFNFAAYVNKSPTLQEFVKLGVELHMWEKKKGIPQFVLKLDFERDIKNHLLFLHDAGITADQLGPFLTKNPLIFKEDTDDLQVRINYLMSKQFTSDMITRIITLNPHWLMFSTQRIDRRLGHFQKTFALNGNEVRAMTLKQPRLLTYNMEHVKLVTFSFKEEMGFENKEVKAILLKRPKLWMMNEKYLLSRFNFVHNKMKIPHSQICEQPQVLGSREFRTRQRHLFLAFLGRAQYDPKAEGYISLERLVAGTDAEFCLDVAKSAVEDFNLFLKTL